jgi:hypothetical protein
MSNNTVIGNSNEWINWIEESIAKKQIRYYMITIILIIFKKLVLEVLEKSNVQIGKILIVI